MRILAAVDIREQPELVLDRVVPWARRFGGTVDVCYASRWSTEGLARLPDPGDESDLLWGEWAKRARADRAELEALAGRLPDDVRGVARTLAGPPTEVILAAAQGYDLVCVLTHHRSGGSRLVHGSISAQVVRSSAVPVLVLGAADPPLAADGPLFVLAPVDGSDAGALPWIAKHVPRHRTELVHVWTEGAPVWVPGGVAAKSSEAVRAELLERARAAGFPDAPLHLADAEGHAGDGVTRVATQLGADIVVLPTHGRHGVARLVLGSVAERVVERADRPVLVVPRALAV